MRIKIIKKNAVITIPIKKLKELLNEPTEPITEQPVEPTPEPTEQPIEQPIDAVEPTTGEAVPQDTVLPPQEAEGDTAVQQ